MPSAAPARHVEESTPTTALDIVRAGVLLVSYIVVSSCLIRFNKYLMHKDRFPFSMALSTLHMSVSSVLCLLFFLLSPSAFPGIANAQGKRGLVLRWFVPIALTFALSLYASNQAYLYCNVAFLQFMKEANVIITFILSLIAGLQVLTRVRVAVVVWIVAGSSMAVSGDLHFVWLGFAFQLISQFAECARAVLGESVLSGNRIKLDPMSYTLFVAPACLAVLLVGLGATWDPNIPVAFGKWWTYLLPNATLAFVLNVLVATVIKEVSAVGFILAGVTKDIFIVMFSCIVFGEVVTMNQVFSFIVTLAGVFFWSFLKVCPDGRVANLAGKLLGDPIKDDTKQPTETTALNQQQKA